MRCFFIGPPFFLFLFLSLFSVFVFMQGSGNQCPAARLPRLAPPAGLAAAAEGVLDALGKSLARPPLSVIRLGLVSDIAGCCCARIHRSQGRLWRPKKTFLKNACVMDSPLPAAFWARKNIVQTSEGKYSATLSSELESRNARRSGCLRKGKGRRKGLQPALAKVRVAGTGLFPPCCALKVRSTVGRPPSTCSATGDIFASESSQGS